MECVTNGWASSNPGLETFCAMEQENLASQKKKKTNKKTKSSKGRDTGKTEKGETLNGFIIWVSRCSHTWIYPLKCQLSHSISYLSKLSSP